MDAFNRLRPHQYKVDYIVFIKKVNAFDRILPISITLTTFCLLKVECIGRRIEKALGQIKKKRRGVEQRKKLSKLFFDLVVIE